MYVTSDVKLENIKRLSGDKAIKQIHKIPARSNYIDKTSKGSDEKLGFVAQEVADVLPGTITTQKNFLPSVMKTLNGTWNG